MTRSRKSFFQVSTPRIINSIVIALVVGIFWTMSMSAQDTPALTAPTQTATAQPASEPEAKSVSPATDDTPTNASMTPGEASTGSGSAFPVVEGAEENQGSFEVSTEAVTPRDPAAEQDDAQAKKKEEDWKNFVENMKLWGVFLAILLICFAAGNYLAKLWRLPEHNVRIFVLLLAFFGSLAAVLLGWHRLTLGIDLQGGVVLVYDVKPLAKVEGGDETQAASGVISNQTMDQLTTAIGHRVNPGGVREISITRLGNHQVQVIIPKAEDAEVDRIQRIISESGALTFRILASTLYPQDADIIERAKRETGREIRTGDGTLLAQWTPVYDGEKGSFLNNPDIITRERRGQLEVLVLYNDGFDVTGKYLTLVNEGMDDSGNPGVSFEFNAIGENKFKRLTSANQPDSAQTRLRRQLGIILNDSLYSAPSINAVIGKRGIITFGRRSTQEEIRQLRKDIQDLINILNAGALPADLSKEPVSRQLIGATLGTDTIQKGKIALISSAIVVLLFMVFYYRLAGFIACFCVVTNILMLIAIMLALRAAFTLPGLAGIVLTIGMAVDANILIYERLREELQGGASLKMAIRNAYAKALSAIVDSNITTIITGVILYAVGTEQVKGFAVTLVLGVSLSMFTAIYCARTIMDIFEAQKSIKTFRMMQLFKRPNINFLGARNACAVFSVLLSLVCIIAVVARGKTIFDIDFVGGVSAEVVFKETQDIGDVRSKLYEKDKTIDDVTKRLNDLAVQNVQSSGEGGGSVTDLSQSKTPPNTRFIITTSIPQVRDREVSPDEYLQTVRNILKETFGNSLVYTKLDYEVKDAAKSEEVDVRLKFFPPINYESLRSTIKAATDKAMAAKIVENDFAYSATTAGYDEGSRQSFTDWTINAHASKETIDKVLGPLKAELDGTPYFPTSTTVGGSVAKGTRTAGLLAVIGSLICIMLYIWLRFHRLVYGIAAVIGLIHDVIVVLGLIALSAWVATPLSFLQVNEFKIGLPVVAAFLTIIGYSLNDTIILFDRIRENRGKNPNLTGTMINQAINQTLSRTVLTSLTTFFVAIILYFWGGQGIHTFAFAMSAGVAFGTYSTIGLCAPLLYWMIGVDDKKND